MTIVYTDRRDTCADDESRSSERGRTTTFVILSADTPFTPAAGKEIQKPL